MWLMEAQEEWRKNKEWERANYIPAEENPGSFYYKYYKEYGHKPSYGAYIFNLGLIAGTSFFFGERVTKNSDTGYVIGIFVWFLILILIVLLAFPIVLILAFLGLAKK